MKESSITIIGAGLCGSLLAILLARRGFDVRVFERRPEPGQAGTSAGRSINLALSARGIRALRHASLFDRVRPLLMPMRGRLIHGEDHTTELQPYGQREDEVIHSVSRAALNRLLIDAARDDAGVKMHFQQEAVAYNREEISLRMADLATGSEYRLRGGPILAADGAGSAIRRSYGAAAPVGATQELLAHGYKELSVPAGPTERHQLDPAALHVWPRGGFMLIALPNPGGDFTLTLFLPKRGRDSFAALDSASAVEDFFARHFADVAPLISDLAGSFMRNPTGVLGTVRCRQWHDGGDLLLVGDAAHAIVPFHGQGMNLGFEDCVLLDGIVQEAERDWADAFARFEREQRANADAIADMALENYVEMRDTVRDPKFRLRKQLSFELERRLPDRFIPRYSMVMFHDDIPYSLAQERGAAQESLLDELTRDVDTLGQIDLDEAAATVSRKIPPLPTNAPASRK